MNVETVLLIILSIGFIILLILCIIFVYILIRIVHSVRNIAERAEETSENLSGIVRSLGKKVGPMALSSLAGLAIKHLRKKKKRKED